MRTVMKDIFLKVMFNTLKNYMNFIIIYPFLPKRMKAENIEKLVAKLHDKKICYTHKQFETNIKSRISIEKRA